ncbi:MAG TPA: SpvB/TcaC N-terminal domain-containing protein [Kofleriaceae bacterium]|jgi:RHS repeat-associated protein
MGTGSLAVPIAVTPGRGGFTPDLALRYDSGDGNGPFGLGFRLSVPSISRKTDKGLPRYIDEPDLGDTPDVFVLSGADDLVPMRVSADADAAVDAPNQGDYRVVRYRPRVESAFARIERWRHRESGDTHWRTIDRTNVLSIYGSALASRVTDPARPDRVFSWLLDETRDDRGNICRYTYKAEDGAGVARDQRSEASRFTADAFTATAQRYLKRALYGNIAPLDRNAPAPTDASAWLFEIVFDYGEHGAATPTPDEEQPWAVRSDPFSTFRPTFDLRTYRRCARALMFHRIAELGAAPVLVRSTDIAYAESHVRAAFDPVYNGGIVTTRIASVESASYSSNGDGTYQRAALPPLTLSFSEPIIHDELHTIDRRTIAGAPGTDAARWIDLDGEGIPGLLVSTPRAWFYQANRGDGRLAAPALERSLPSTAELAGGAAMLADLDGDGHLDLVHHAGALGGYFARTDDRRWRSFISFAETPRVDWTDPNLRMVDLDGDGLVDILIAEDTVFRWYPSHGARGYGPARVVPKPPRDDGGPAIVFADRTETIHLADMTGDGLVDLVRVRHDHVCYWPNLGYGRFGAKVSLDGDTLFDSYDRFEPTRVRLADIDGSGTSDIVYSSASGTRVWFNRAGNALSPPLAMRSLPSLDPLSRVDVVDVLGTGTACLVWASSLPAVADRPVRYVELLPTGKPYLLVGYANNLGAETRIEYEPSTRFYLDDAAGGRPWITRLPFPLHVVTRVERLEHVTNSTMVTRFAYHHGFYDGYEREFRGFAMVEQWDAESFSGGDPGNELVVPPAHSKTWFHTGAWLDRERIEDLLAREYYADDALAPALSDIALPAALTTREQREAARARRGQVLRHETYADDGTPHAQIPYQVTSYRHEIAVLQRAIGPSHAAFHSRQVEAVVVHYERDADDPRTQHELVLAIDDFGNVLRSVSVSYPRRGATIAGLEEQWRMWATVADRTVVNQPAESDWYRVGVIIEERASELIGVTAPSNADVLSRDALRAALVGAAVIPFEGIPDPSRVELRVIADRRYLYYSDDLTAPLALGVVASRALPYQTYDLALTSGLVTGAFGGLVDAATLVEGGYVSLDANWWVPSDRAVFDPARFYLPVAAIDPFDQQYTVTYDSLALAVVATRDALGNSTAAQIDYRVMQPALITDPNGNRIATAFDVLGLPVAIAMQGKAGSTDGDTLADPTTQVEYDVLRWQTSGGTQPAYAHSYAREQHGATNTRWLESVTYTDGFSRAVMTKAQAAPDPVSGATRWIGTGRTVFDNKGNPVRTYEPFFAATSDFETEEAVVTQGVTPLLHYDPLGRLVRTDFPDGTVSRVELTSWQQTTWDANDSVSGSAWFARMSAGSPSEQRAATLAIAHANTPNVAHVDALGRAFLRIADAGNGDLRQTRIALDVSGNALVTTDARGIAIGTQIYDLMAHALHAILPDAGETSALADVQGQPLRSWSARGFRHRRGYDALRRPTHLYSLAPDFRASEILVERTVYGDALAADDARAANALGRVVRSFDAAGVMATTAYDFKGNVSGVARTLATTYATTLDWTSLGTLTDIGALDAAAAGLLSSAPGDTFTISATYDALNRVASKTTPDGSVASPSYDDGARLDQIDVRLHGAAAPTSFVAGIQYNARGDRTLVSYGNGTTTTYSYDPYSFRLATLTTRRDASGFALQDLEYTYDAVGNIVQLSDAVSYGNSSVAAGGLYEYDPLYQLTLATGREHPGQQPTAADTDLLRLDHPADLQALRPYREQYSYDVAGNLATMAHIPLDGSSGWTRRYSYAADSNRLLATSLPGDAAGHFSSPYTHDGHGNMTVMPHLAVMEWDHADRFVAANLGGGGSTYFVYDGGGERVRKVYVHGGAVEERIYLDGFEIYRNRNASSGTIALERETLHVVEELTRVALVETTTINSSVAAFTPVMRTRFQLADQLSSSLFELDESAGVISYEEYFAFGGTAWHAIDGATDVSAKRYRYVGLERDEETGLDYASARYYASWLGRWIASDPIALRGGSNLFQFCGNGPITRTDTGGTDWGWLNPHNWCSPFDSDCEVAPVEFVKGAGSFIYDTAKTTLERTSDLATLSVASFGKWTGLYSVGYTTYSPEANNYDPDKSIGQNIHSNLHAAGSGVVTVFKNAASGDPRALGQVGAMVAIARAGGRPGATPPPSISFQVPALAIVSSTAGELVPVVVSKGVTVTIPASEAALAAGGTTMLAIAGNGGGKSGGGKSSGSSKSPGTIASKFGGKKAIPRGTNLALGLFDNGSLQSFTASLENAEDVTSAYDKQYFQANLNSTAWIKGVLTDLGELIIGNGGRLKFNLDGMQGELSGLDQPTNVELRTILADPYLEAHTDFYEGSQLLPKNSALDARLAPWR